MQIQIKDDIKSTFIWQDPELLKAFLDLQLCEKERSVNQLAIDWKWSRPRVYRFMEKLGSVTTPVTSCVTTSVTTNSTNNGTYADERTPSVTSSVTTSVTNPKKTSSGNISTIKSNTKSNTKSSTTKKNSKALSNSINSNRIKKKEKIYYVEKRKKSFIEKPENLQMVIEEFKSRNIPHPESNAKKFMDHYDANGWFRGKTKIRRWRSCISQWDFQDMNSGRSRSRYGDQGSPLELKVKYQCITHPEQIFIAEGRNFYKLCKICSSRMKEVDVKVVSER